MLCAVGDLVEDVVVWLPGPIHLAADTVCHVSRHRGGSAANVAAVAARLGATARFVGRVGDDDLGGRLLARLEEEGVDAPVEREGHTGSIVVLVTPDGERTMLGDRGVATALTSPRRDWLDGIAVLHVPAYSLDGQPLASTTRQLLAWATESGIAISIDASSTTTLEAIGVDAFLREVADLDTTLLFANAEEAALLGLGAGEPAAGVAVTVVKDGPRPATVVSADGTSVQVPVPPVDGVNDTTGAGDAFAAGFLVAWRAGASPADAALAGHHAAARVISGPGGDAWT